MTYDNGYWTPVLASEVEHQAQFQELQSKLWAWQDYNFGPTGPLAPPRHQFLGMCEEAGEPVHSVLKLSQGIRGTKEEHITHIKDAIGDIMVYMINFYYRGQMGYIESNESYFLKEIEQRSYSYIQLEMLAWCIYKNILKFGLYFEPAFMENTHVPPHYCSSINECTTIILSDMVYLCNLLGTTLYECLDNVWTNVLSQRDWKINPVKGVA